MKKKLNQILLALFALAFAACNRTPKSATPSPAPEAAASTGNAAADLIVFAAASMTETMTEIAGLYKAEAPHVSIVYTFDSSGTLLTQIREGATCDIFISAAQRQMNTLEEAGGVDTATRFNLVENTVALVVPKGNPANIRSFPDAIAAESIALGNADVPVGQYSEEIFTNMGAWNDEFRSRVSFGSNVKEVTSWVSEGVVSCGVVYSTDAASAGLEVVASAPEGTLKTPVIYPAAVLKESANPDAARKFLDFLKSPAAAAVFKKVGFSIP
jgi:molybdate transport system substrate-binding protein